MELHIETRTRENAHIIDIKGDVDLYSSPQMRKCIFKTIKQHHPANLIVELSRVTYMDSSGIATLVEGLQLSDEYHTRLKLVGPSQAVLEVFQLSRLEGAFTMYTTEDDAFRDT